jgi:hypothetical protein
MADSAAVVLVKRWCGGKTRPLWVEQAAEL